MSPGIQGRRKDSSFSEEKEAKRLFTFDAEKPGLSASNE
jgi:hypothetical protein